MNYSTIESTIDKTLNDIMESAIISSGYESGGSITLLLEHTVNGMLDTDEVKDLWGPGWSVFLVMLADRIRPAVSSEASILGVREILCRMAGYSNTTPNPALAVKTRLPDDEVTNVINLDTFGVEQYVEVATGICKDLDIPTPDEVLCMYDALGYMADACEVTRLYRLKPVTGRPITKHNVSDMVTLMYAKDTVVMAASQTKDIIKKIKHTTSCSREEAEKNALTVEHAVGTAIRAERNMVLAERDLLSPTVDKFTADLKPIWPHYKTPVCGGGIVDMLAYVFIAIFVVLMTYVVIST